MNGWLRHQASAIGRAFRNLARNPLGSLLTAIVIGIALALPAGGLLLLDNANRVVGDVSEKPEISIFMAMPPDAAATAEVERRLAGLDSLEAVRFVPREEALAQLSAGGLQDVVSDLAENPLPDAFVIAPRGNDPGAFDALAATFRSWPGVHHVQLDSAWVERIHALIDLGRQAFTLLAAILAAALVVVTFNTIRLQLMTQRAEIEVSRLLGATDNFIRRPFLWTGMLQGLAGGLVAWLLVAAMVAALRDPVATLATSYGASFSLGQPAMQEVMTLLAVAAVLGFAGAALSVDRHLREAA
ncbi:MAG: permease-like cell division protein FtsX [Rhodocyclaceae bacterium]|nr:permease-like cell division protein FtsX [Rhodocyclaceae bacterium]